MLAKELLIFDSDAASWRAVQPLLDMARRLEQNDDAYCGWDKHQISVFLQSLPEHCVLLAGVWETDEDEHESLVLGCVCEVRAGEVCSIRTFETLTEAGLPPVETLEPGYEHALEIMRVARIQVAPVAWALFTDKATWDEWLFAHNGDAVHQGAVNHAPTDKGELLAQLAHQGRCVLLGSQVKPHHP